MSDATKFIAQLVAGSSPAGHSSKLHSGEIFESIAQLTEGGPSAAQAPEPPPDDPFESIAQAIEGGPPAAQSPAPSLDEASAFDVEAINRDHALLLMGSRAVVVRERSDGPITDRIRFLAPEAFRLVNSNRLVGKIPLGNFWLSHPRRRTYAGVEFFPNPDGAKGTSAYLNLWRGYEFEPSPDGTYNVFDDHL